MIKQDISQRFLFEAMPIRGDIVKLEQSYQEIMNKHNYPPLIRKLLGECLVATVLLTSMLKFEGQLSLQFQSVGAIKLLLTKCNDQLEIRAVAQFDADKLNVTNADDLLKQGKMAVIIDQPNAKEPYQSLIPLTENNIAANLEHYFAQSEQLATKLWLAVNEQQASGMLLQLLPEETSNKERENFWEHAVKLGETITDAELLSLDNQTLLHRLYHQEDLRLFDSKSIIFKCTCDKDRMQNIVAMIGREETEIILQKKQQVVITCEFCNSEYAFDKIDVEVILREHQL